MTVFFGKSRIVLGAVSLAALVIAASGVAASARSSISPDVIPGQYIIVLKDSAADSASVGEAMAAEHGLGIQSVYSHVLHGFAATVPASQLQALEHDPRVAYVSADAVVNAFGKPGSPAPQPAQSVPTGIQRVQARASALTGAGIGVAVIDTGIDLHHPDLAGNIVANTSCITGKKTGDDDNGHGTHVAGTIAALDNTVGVVGVAPQAKLVAVKVLNTQGSGSWSSIICGLDWVAAHASTYNIEVANMSLGGSGSSDNNCGITNGDALHQAICRTRDAGVTIVVAAGNSAADASTSVPSAYDDAVITVSALADSDGASGGAGASTSYGTDDTFASFSNFGSVVDIGAPGVNILSTWKGGGYNTISGTSMATPHVAGAAALYLQAHPGSTWTQVRDALAGTGESLGAGHTDPSGLHSEAVVNTVSF